VIALTPKQKQVLAARANVLVTGGPGSGKTTVAILKAAAVADAGLQPAQKILFLSFARATVARILEAIAEESTLTAEARRRIEVDTYHAFFWRILKTHGYLVGLPRRLDLLTPPNEAIALSFIRRGFKAPNKLSATEQIEKAALEAAERTRLATEDGRVCFGLFAPYVAQLLGSSHRIRQLTSVAFPCVVLDEFQDTSADQWGVVKAIGQTSTLIALADPEQRIFEFAGAEAKRLQQYKDTFRPTIVDLQAENHRSKGTDIALFGNDILTGRFTKKAYEGIHYDTFAANANQAFSRLHSEALQARARLVKAGTQNWSVAILVPTRKLTRLVSDALREPLAGMPPIAHTAAVEMEGPILAAELLAYLLQQEEGSTAELRCVELICGFFRGKHGDTPTKTDTTEADRIDIAYARCAEKEATGAAPPKNSLYHAIHATLREARTLTLTGDPDIDWITVRTVLEASACPRLREMASEVRNVRLLERGMQLRQALSNDWRANGAYPNALAITRTAFVQEHFASAFRPEKGVVVMNMHKAKGKQFDEVIIFEGWPVFNGNQISANPHRIVRDNRRTGDLAQARQTFRVSLTRAKQRTTILTPARDCCILLIPESQP
jgi:DNA helicase II / ATP-dependent DNA helicase PcrA